MKAANLSMTWMRGTIVKAFLLAAVTLQINAPGAATGRELFSEVSAPSMPGDAAATRSARNREPDPGGEESFLALLASERLVVLKAGAAPLAVEDFLSLDGRSPTRKTMARIGYDKNGLSVSFECLEADMPRLEAGVKARDQDLSGDDAVEIRIDLGGSGRSWFQIHCNSLGVVRDERVLGSRLRDTGWDLSRQASITRHPDRWTAGIVIPFSDLGIYDDPANSLIRLSLARRRMTGGEPELLAWGGSDPQRAHEAGFRPVLLTDGRDPQALSCISLSRGELSREGTIWGGNVFLALVRNRSGGKQTLHGKAIARNEAGDVLGSDAAMLELAPGAESVISLQYQVTGRPGDCVHVTIAADHSPEALYEARWPTMYDLYAHTSGVDDPLFEELLSGQPASDLGGGGFLWQHPLNYTSMRAIARRMGLAYSPLRLMTEMAGNGVALLTGPIVFTDYDDLKPYWPQTGLRICYYPIDYPASDRHIVGDDAVEGLLQQVGDVIDKHRDRLWAVFAGDEQDKYAMRWPFTAGGKLELPRHEVNHPVYIKVDAEVKEQFGFGRFGAPLTWEDNDPFRRIAYYRYINARMRERHRKLRDLVKEKAPELLLVSTDPVSGHHPYEFSLQREIFDVFTHQTSPTKGDGPFIVKLLADLTGKDVWPCAHIEGSRNTVQDVRLKLSRLIARGATGFHGYFAFFYTNPQRPELLTPYFSSPPRFRAFLRACSLMQSMPRLAFPGETALAVFYSNYSNMADPGSLRYPGQQANFHGWEIQRAHGMMVRARHWFRFTDEHLLEETLGAGLKVLYLPKNGYQDRDTYDRLTSFVEKGGVIVCTDPVAFRYDIDGAATADRRQALFGLRIEATQEVARARVELETPAFFTALRQGDTLDLSTGPGDRPFTVYRIAPEDPATVLARFENGDPAIITRPVGAGRTFYFAFDPFGPVYAGADREKWLALFKSLNTGLGIPADCAVWRFELPAEKFRDLEPALPEGMCLTGNFMYWDMEQPVQVKNLDTGGSYTYSRAPDLMKDAAAGDESGDELDDLMLLVPKAIPFTSGDLTDRHHAYREVFPGRENSRYCDYDQIRADEWAVAWKERSAIDLTFDLERRYPVIRLRLFFSGQLPRTTMAFENEAGKWVDCASVGPMDAGDDVLVAELDPKTVAASRRLRVRFGARPAGATLTLTEVEIWGEAE